MGVQGAKPPPGVWGGCPPNTIPTPFLARKGAGGWSKEFLSTLLGTMQTEDMAEDIISMHDIGVIFEVTDALGVDRESISVPLGKEDPGTVRRLSDGEVEIVVPASVPIEEWAATLKAEMEKLGFEPVEEE
ncbi:MAG: hypothetical protein HW388_1311 [Dehalococcoidia bacterium]|nr:hypothetical protein [Dehalococcoidia bacterium]